MVEEPADFGDVTEGLRRGCSQGEASPTPKTGRQMSKGIPQEKRFSSWVGNVKGVLCEDGAV